MGFHVYLVLQLFSLRASALICAAESRSLFVHGIKESVEEFIVNKFAMADALRQEDLALLVSRWSYLLSVLAVVPRTPNLKLFFLLSF